VPSKVEHYDNVVVCSNGGYGVNLLLRQMIGDTALPIELDEVVFGTGTNVPAVTDTALQTETVNGITPALMSVANNVITIDIFVPSALMPNDTYKEMGLNATNRLFTRSAMNYVKGASQDTTIEYTITYTL